MPVPPTTPYAFPGLRGIVQHCAIFAVIGPLIGMLICPVILELLSAHGGSLWNFPTRVGETYSQLFKTPSALMMATYTMGGLPALMTGLASGVMRLRGAGYILTVTASGFMISAIFAILIVQSGLSPQALRISLTLGLTGAFAAISCLCLATFLRTGTKAATQQMRAVF